MYSECEHVFRGSTSRCVLMNYVYTLNMTQNKVFEEHLIGTVN